MNLSNCVFSSPVTISNFCFFIWTQWRFLGVYFFIWTPRPKVMVSNIIRGQWSLTVDRDVIGSHRTCIFNWHDSLPFSISETWQRFNCLSFTWSATFCHRSDVSSGNMTSTWSKTWFSSPIIHRYCLSIPTMESGLFTICISLILVGDHQWSVFQILDSKLDRG